MTRQIHPAPSLSWQRASTANATPQPWRNGGGQTRELLCWPVCADWVLRISVAEITRDGAFSPYPGIDRWFAVLQGAGVRLLGGSHQPGGPLLPFRGEVAPDCALIDGPTRDFNFMHKRGRGRVTLLPATSPWSGAADWLGLFSITGGSVRGGQDSAELLQLAPLELGWCRPGRTVDLQFAAATVAAAADQGDHGDAAGGAASADSSGLARTSTGHWWLAWSAS